MSCASKGRFSSFLRRLSSARSRTSLAVANARIGTQVLEHLHCRSLQGGHQLLRLLSVRPSLPGRCSLKLYLVGIPEHLSVVFSSMTMLGAERSLGCRPRLSATPRGGFVGGIEGGDVIPILPSTLSLHAKREACLGGKN